MGRRRVQCKDYQSQIQRNRAKQKELRLKQSQLYDDDGYLVSDRRDISDCLEAHCPGCHFPCQKCGSEKCGAQCRVYRLWYYTEVEVEGANLKTGFSATSTKTWVHEEVIHVLQSITCVVLLDMFTNVRLILSDMRMHVIFMMSIVQTRKL